MKTTLFKKLMRSGVPKVGNFVNPYLKKIYKTDQFMSITKTINSLL